MPLLFVVARALVLVYKAPQLLLRVVLLASWLLQLIENSVNLLKKNCLLLSLYKGFL